jgi:hypothetical protein
MTAYPEDVNKLWLFVYIGSEHVYKCLVHVGKAVLFE